MSSNRCKSVRVKNAEELKRNQDFFWKIYLDYLPKKRKTLTGYFNKQDHMDIINDFIVYFQEHYAKTFDWDFGEIENRYRRAVSFYLERFYWFILDGYHSRKFRRILSADSQQRVTDLDEIKFQDICYSCVGEGSDSHARMTNKDICRSNELRSLLNDDTHSKYHMTEEYRVYIEGLLDFINRIENFRESTKNRIVSFLTEFLKYGDIRINFFFGTGSTYYKDILKTLINEYDHVYGEPEVEVNPYFLYNIPYKVATL